MRGLSQAGLKPARIIIMLCWLYVIGALWRLKKAELSVAVLLYGVDRSLELVHHSITRSILHELSERNIYVKIFAHEVLLGEKRPSSNYKLIRANVVEGWQQNQLRAEKHSFFKRINEFGDAWNNNNVSTMNELTALTSLKRAAELASSDLVAFDGLVVLRPDLLYIDKLDVSLLIDSVRTKSVVIPNWQWYEGCNDRFSYGAWTPMLKIAQRVDQIEAFCLERNGPFHAEEFMLWNIMKNHIKMNTTTQRGLRVRPGGNVFILDVHLLNSSEKRWIQYHYDGISMEGP